MKQWILRWVALAVLSAGWMGCETVPSRTMSSMTAEDRELVFAVRDRLAMDVVTMNQQFNVTAQNGVVTLFGVVPDNATRMRVVNVVRGTQGVRDVVDRISAF